jgi:hypothetical protein
VLHKAGHAVAKETFDKGFSKFSIMVAESGFILAVSEHIRDR